MQIKYVFGFDLDILWNSQSFLCPKIHSQTALLIQFGVQRPQVLLWDDQANFEAF